MRSLFSSVIAVAFCALAFAFSTTKNGTESKALVCDSIPQLNKDIIAFVKTKVNKKVDRGECWNLAAAALNGTGAKWDKSFGFGKEVNYKKDCVYPGDIIQFENVKIKYQEGNKIFTEEMTQHTAIVYEVKNIGDYVVAEQNTSMHGKKVSLDPLDLKNVIKGKFKIYEPVK